MKLCARCGTQLSDEVLFCSNCGNAAGSNAAGGNAAEKKACASPFIAPCANTTIAIRDFFAKASLLHTLGIVAASFFGSGLILSIVIWIMAYVAKAPAVLPADPVLQHELEQAKKKKKTALILSLVPVIAIALIVLFYAFMILLSFASMS